MKVNVECSDGILYHTKITEAETGIDLSRMISHLEIEIKDGRAWVAKLELYRPAFLLKHISAEFTVNMQRARELLTPVMEQLLTDREKTLADNNERLEDELRELRGQLESEQKINRNLRALLEK